MRRRGGWHPVPSRRPKVFKIGRIYQSVIERFYTMINEGKGGQKGAQYAIWATNTEDVVKVNG